MSNNTQIKERFVIFLDIMGFKERVARSSAEDLYTELTEFNLDITKIISSFKQNRTESLSEQNNSSEAMLSSNKNEIEIAQFSDSIVLFSDDNSRENLLTISEAAKKIMLAAINRDKPIPLKGALAEGIITCDTVKQLFFGQALIDAYLLEENVQYYGIVVHHTAEESVRNLNNSVLFRNGEVSLKSGKIEHYELIWYNDPETDVESGLDKIRLSVSDYPRKYVDNTRSILKDFREQNTAPQENTK